MAHFAEIDKDAVVLRVVVISDNDAADEAAGVAFCNRILGNSNTWLQTSYGTWKGKHRLGGTPFRKNFASAGFTYDRIRDAFIPPRPFLSWSLDEETCTWTPPVPMPSDGSYEWDEDTLSWTIESN